VQPPRLCRAASAVRGRRPCGRGRPPQGPPARVGSQAPRLPRRSSAASERGTAITAAAEAEGIRPTKALEIAENPTALRAAILADPSTAQAARTALLDRLKEDPALQTELARDIARTDELKKAVATETQAAGRIGYVRQIVENGQVKTPAGQTIDASAELRAEAERHLSLIDELDDDELDDDELDDDEQAGQWASEAPPPGAPHEVLQQPAEGDEGLRGPDLRRRRGTGRPLRGRHAPTPGRPPDGHRDVHHGLAEGGAGTIVR
jgi:hypothetical protein